MAQWTYRCIRGANRSGGWHSWLIDEVLQHWNAEYKTVAAVTDNKAAEPTLSKLLHGADVTALPTPPDLNTAIEWPTRYDVVICQATLEHVCRPSICMENLVRLTSCGGLLSVHSHPPSADGYHAHPVDCCRFYTDFFTSLQDYLPYRVITTYVGGGNVFCLARSLYKGV